ncbi:MAG: DUF5309 domain-containing protein [Gammaproteobacteria bacterium]|nr:DUF5309 domain-containing protein [Gammaproteobacteria bacterium]MCP4275262.1 DUF5309 domain-containing protein [Gammaproteobacteria bacterium]
MSDNLSGANLAAVNLNGLINESFVQAIFDISDIPLPLTSAIGKGSHDNEYHSWSMDRLSDPVTTGQRIDGDTTAQANQSKIGRRVGNHSEQKTKTLRLSRRGQNSSVPAQQNQMAYQISRRGNEMRRDNEAAMLSNNASVVDDGDTVAGVSAGLNAWICNTTVDGLGVTENVVLNGATIGGWDVTVGDSLVAAATPTATPVALSYADVLSVCSSIYKNGSDAANVKIMNTPAVHELLNDFAFDATFPGATITNQGGDSSGSRTMVSAANVIVGPFGVYTMVSNRLQPLVDTNDSTCFVLDTSVLKQSFLTGYQVKPLATETSMADNREMLCDYTLQVDNWEAIGGVMGISQTDAVVA